AVVLSALMEAGGFDALEVSEAGLREGAFFERFLDDRDPPLFEDVRRASVINLASRYEDGLGHQGHVAKLSLEIYDGLAEARLIKPDDADRELLWAASMLHDIGTAVDYDDHHKHSQYLILNAGLDGFTPRETALIGQAARYHRKGNPTLGEFEPLMREGDDGLLRRLAAMLRV